MDLPDVLAEPPVPCNRRDFFPNHFVGFMDPPPGTEGKQELQPLGGAQELHGQDLLHVCDDIPRLPGRDGAYGDVIFLVCRSGNGVPLAG